VARVAHWLPHTNRRSPNRSDDRLQAPRVWAPRHGGVPDRLRNLGQRLFDQHRAEVVDVSQCRAGHQEIADGVEEGPLVAFFI
jgi:hypothetical protein